MKLLKRYYLLLLPFLALLLNACNNESAKPEIKLKGKWIVSDVQSAGKSSLNDSLEHHLNLNVNKDGMPFSTNFFLADSKVTGEWSVSGDTLWFDYVVPNANLPIDSLDMSTNETGDPKFTVYSEQKEVGSIENGTLTPVKKNQFAKIVSQTDEELVLDLQGVGKFTMSKEVVEQGGFSLVSIGRGIMGLAFLLGLAWLFSSDRKSIDWNLVWKGVVMQIVIALLVLKAPFVESIFTYISQGFVTLIGYTNEGINFVFGDFASGKIQPPLITFAFKVLPTIIFFSALMSLLYYWGVLQKIVFVFAWVMKKFMRLSGAESLAAAGNVFLGQTEAPLLVKPYLLGMTKSEIMCLMTGGMATIAGGVLASYIGYLGGDDPEAQVYFAKHLLTASVISAPAAIVAAKILVPEKEKINEDLKISKDKIGTNALEAISNGTTDGLKLAVNVGAMLIVFISLVALANGILGWVGNLGGINDWIASNTEYDDLSFEFLLGYACAPIVWILGVDSVDMVHVGELLGQKTILNEFYAYGTLGEKNAAGLLNDKSVVMATYMLCGFANIASIGIQIGGIGALIPSRKGLLSQLGVKALIGGTIACLLTAVVVGMTM